MNQNQLVPIWLRSWDNFHPLNLTVFLCVLPAPLIYFFFSSLDDDYSDTYNATYAVISNGETRLAPTNSHRPLPPVFRLYATSQLLRPISQQTTTACRPTPPWPTPHPGRTRIGLSPKARPTTAAAAVFGSLRLPQCLLLLRPCLPSCSWGPETASETKTQLTRTHCLSSLKITECN